MSTIYTRDQLWGSLEPKHAEASGTSVMPMAGEPEKTPSKDMKYIPKAASRIDVSGLDAPTRTVEKTATHFALPSLPRYPLDTFAQVKQASAYFEEHGSAFAPSQRREYCSNLQKRAEALGLDTTPTVQKYAASSYGTTAEIELGLHSRMSVVDEDQRPVLQKIAEIRGTLSPEMYASLLGEFDKVAGIEHLYDRAVVDPYLSTYGVKVAESPEDGSYVDGALVVMYKDLVRLGKTKCQGLKDLFGCDFVDEFRKDPVGIFKSLPVDQKKLVGRMSQEILINY